MARKRILTFAAAGVWLAAWELAARAVGRPILFPPFSAVAARLLQLVGSGEFYGVLVNSLAKISLGFLGAAAAGLTLAALARRFETARELLRPVMSAVKSAPVASFIILALILVSSKYLSTLIAFLMALPVIYANTLAGADSIGREKFELADVFGVYASLRFKAVYLPEVYPYFAAGCSTALGLAWKAGVAAEVIGIAAGTIGEKLYESKIYLDIPSLFSYTAAVVAISALSERLVSYLLNRAYKRLVGGPRRAEAQAS